MLRAKGIVGLGHTSKMDETVWNEFFDNPEKLAYESERIIAERMHLSRRTVENHLYLSRIEMREFMRKAM